MARQITNSLFNSLRGRIWISTSVLAFFICTFGLISYLVVSLLISDLFYGIFIPFLLLSFVVVVFGWWLSNEIVSPIEGITLLSKSLERSSSTSLPKSSGSYETDQLLESLFRNSRQMQLVVTLMDKLAAGETDISLAELDGAERLDASFKKLLAKVSESISAKEELERLRNSIEQLKRELSPVRSGNLAVELSIDDAEMKEIANTIRYLLDNLSTVISMIRSDSLVVRESAREIEGSLQRIIQQDESRISELGQASATLKQVPTLVEKISENLSSSSQSAKQSIEKARHGSQIANKTSGAVGQLKKQLREAIKRIQALNERTQEIGKIGNTVEDLANRTNMISLNASIQAAELGERGQGFALVAEEVDRLANRANVTTRHIAALNKNITVEVKKVENSLESTTGDISNLSKFAIETGNILGELERYFGQFINLQESLATVSGDQAEETDKAFLTFLNSITESEVTVDELKHSTAELTNLSKLVKNLQAAVGEFRIGYEETPLSDTAEKTPSQSANIGALNKLGGSAPVGTGAEKDKDRRQAAESKPPEQEAVPDLQPPDTDVIAEKEPRIDVSQLSTEEEFESDELNVAEFYRDLQEPSSPTVEEDLIRKVT